MKKKVGELFHKPIVIGDPNIVTDNEILLQEINKKIVLSERTEDGEFSTMTPEGSSNISDRFYNMFQLAIIKLGEELEDEKILGTVVKTINIDGHDGEQTIYYDPKAEFYNDVITLVPFDYFKIGDSVIIKTTGKPVRAPYAVGNIVLSKALMLASSQGTKNDNQTYTLLTFTIETPVQTYYDDGPAPCYALFSYFTEEETENIPMIHIQKSIPV